MGQDPSEIRKDIEQTREQMGQTVDALGYKTDVKARAKDGVMDRVGAVKGALTGATGKVSEATPDGSDVRHAAGVAQDNPLGLAIGAVAVGFLAGMLIPETKVEHERLGEMADQVKDQVKDTAQEAVQHGKEIAQETAQSAKETAQQAAQEHGSDLKDSAKESVEQTREQVSAS